MSTTILFCVLLAAVLHASWNALVKVGGDGLVRLAIINMTASLCCLPLLFFVALPAPASWPYLAASILIHQAYYVFLILGYRFGDLSLVYPIARGIAPILVALGAYALADERLNAAGIVAVILICGAILSLALERGRISNIKAVGFALCTGLTIAAYTVCDGIGGRLTDNVFSYIAWLFVLEGPLIFLLAVWLRRRMLVETLKTDGRAGVIGGICAVIAYGLVIWAMSTTTITYVSAVRETSVIIATLIGTRLMREPAAARRMLAAGVVVVGVVLLQLKS